MEELKIYSVITSNVDATSPEGDYETQYFKTEIRVYEISIVKKEGNKLVVTAKYPLMESPTFHGTIEEITKMVNTGELVIDDELHLKYIEEEKFLVDGKKIANSYYSALPIGMDVPWGETEKFYEEVFYKDLETAKQAFELEWNYVVKFFSQK